MAHGTVPQVYERSTQIREYAIVAGLPDVDLSREGRHVFVGEKGGAPHFEVEVIDPTEDYVALMASLFDFDALRSLLRRPDMSLVFDGMHGVAGPYARAIFGALGVADEALPRPFAGAIPAVLPSTRPPRLPRRFSTASRPRTLAAATPTPT